MLSGPVTIYPLALLTVRFASYGKIIMEEAHLPKQLKTITPVQVGGIAGGEKYIIRGILFKVRIRSVFAVFVPVFLSLVTPLTCFSVRSSQWTRRDSSMMLQRPPRQAVFTSFLFPWTP